MKALTTLSGGPNSYAMKSYHHYILINARRSQIYNSNLVPYMSNIRDSPSQILFFSRQC